MWKCKIQNDALLSGQAFQYEKIRIGKGTLGLGGIKQWKIYILTTEIGQKRHCFDFRYHGNGISSRLTKTIFLPEVVMKIEKKLYESVV